MSASLRWSLVALVALVGVVVALLSTIGSNGTIGNNGEGPGPAASAPTAPAATAPPAGSPPADEPYTSVDPDTRAAAGLPACRDSAAPATTVGPVAGFMVRCMDDGDTTTLGKIQAGAPMLVNLWAYWCEPCRRELPAIRDAQATLGDSVRVVLSHTDPSETKGFDTLSALGVEDLISVSDPDEDLPTLLGAPPVLPVTVFVRADGSVAHVLVEPMHSEQDVLDAVEEYLGVTA